MHDVGYRKAILQFLEKHTYRETVEEFGVSSASLSSWKTRLKETGSLEANYHGTRPKIDHQAVIEYVDAHPDAYQDEVAKVFGYAQSTVCGILKEYGYTFKKKPAGTLSRTRQR